MVLIEDKGQKTEHHKIKNEYWESENIKVLRFPLPTGDYCIANEKVIDAINRKKARGHDVKKMDFLGCYNIAVDTKKDLAELYQNLVQSHTRFRDELILAQNNNIKLYILVENEDNVKRLEDVACWKNPRYYMWMKNMRRVFTKIMKEWYRENNAIKFFENRNIPIPASDIKKKYFEELKKVDIKDVVEYMKNKKVKAYLKNNDIKVRKRPMSNEALVKTMESMQNKYDVTFLFCTPEESGQKIIDLLNV